MNGTDESGQEVGRTEEGPPRVRPDFYRAHGLGNDYLVFEGADPGPGEGWVATPSAVRAICERWTGVGSDGIVVLVDPGARADFPLRMFNPDGSEFERSGNGLRILGSHLARTGRVPAGDPFTVRSGGSAIGMRVHGTPERGRWDVSVEMGRARVGPDAVELDGGGRGEALPGEAPLASLRHPARGDLRFVPVSVGNPHAVVFTEDLSAEALEDVGPFLSEHPAFRKGANVQLARVPGAGRLRISIWERGVGRTSASGTSSCAAAVAAVHRGLLEPGPVAVEMAGGTLDVVVSPELEVVLRGPVQEVAEGVLTPGFLARLEA